MLLNPMEEYASLVCLTNDLHRISEAASHETEVNVVELRIRVDPFVFGVVDNEAQIRRDAGSGLVFWSTRDGIRRLQGWLARTQIDAEDLEKSVKIRKAIPLCIVLDNQGTDQLRRVSNCHVLWLWKDATHQNQQPRYQSQCRYQEHSSDFEGEPGGGSCKLG